MTPLTHQPTRILTSGAIWPLGRSQARDEAQIRQCERDLQTLPLEAAQCA